MRCKIFVRLTMRAIFHVCAEIYKEWLVHANGFVWGLFISLEVYENLVNDSFHTIIWKYSSCYVSRPVARALACRPYLQPIFQKIFHTRKRLLSKDAYPPGFPFHLNLYKPTFFRGMVNIRVYSYQVVQSSKSTIFLNLSTPMTLVRDKKMLWLRTYSH